MFSRRTDWNLAPNDLTKLLEEKRSRGTPIVDLTESNPTRCGFSYSSRILESLADPSALQYDPDPRGTSSARKSIADYYHRKGIPVTPEAIILTASTSEAYTYLFTLLCDAGESVLVPKPSYPLFDYLCRLNDVEAVHYRLRYDDEWHIDFDSLRENVDSTTRAVLLVNPNNPTGSYAKKNERDKLVDFARRHELALIVDEVFFDYPIVERDDWYGSFAAEGGVTTFTLNGISKMLGLPQMKLAWLTLSGSAEVVRSACDQLEIIADTYLSVGTPIQRALPKLLADSTVTDEIRERIRSNHRSLHSRLAGQSGSLLSTEAGWSAIVRLPNVASDDAWALQVLKNCNVLVHPGHFFEIEQESCIVLSLLPAEAMFLDGITKITKYVSKNS
jgi:alanine-synthesizing transaminase